MQSLKHSLLIYLTIFEFALTTRNQIVLTFFQTNVMQPKCSLYLFSVMILLVSGCTQHETEQKKRLQNPSTTSEEGNELTASEKDEGWKLLFDGKTTTGWRGINQEAFPSEGWKAEEGMLMVNATDGEESGNGGDIITTRQYSNFVLDWDWKMMTRGGNSGVKYFVKEGLSDNLKYGVGLEYQILDDENHAWMLEGKMQPGDYYTLGALYEIYPATNRSVKPLGEWNHSRIVSQGKHVEHWLNGVKILEYERGGEDFRKKVAASKFNVYDHYGEANEGYILLQDHGSNTAFRNIKIKVL